MNNDELKFKIDQLRKDKIIYGVEACATTLTCLLIFLFSNEYFPSGLKNLVNLLVLFIAVGYTTYMGIGNFQRLSKIKKLEKKLETK